MDEIERIRARETAMRNVNRDLDLEKFKLEGRTSGKTKAELDQ